MLSPSGPEDKEVRTTKPHLQHFLLSDENTQLLSPTDAEGDRNLWLPVPSPAHSVGDRFLSRSELNFKSALKAFREMFGRPLRVCFSGGIAVGKTTLINQFRDSCVSWELRPAIAPERIIDDLFPVLEKYYRSPRQTGMIVQLKLLDSSYNYLVTEHDPYQEFANNDIVLIDRSVLDTVAFTTALAHLGIVDYAVAEAYTTFVEHLFRDTVMHVTQRFKNQAFSPEADLYLVLNTHLADNVKFFNKRLTTDVTRRIEAETVSVSYLNEVAQQFTENRAFRKCLHNLNLPCAEIFYYHGDMDLREQVIRTITSFLFNRYGLK